MQHSAISVLHTFQFTVAPAIRYFVFTSRLLATDLDTQTITVSPDYALQILHIKPSLHGSTLHSSRRELSWTAEFSLPLLFSLTQLTTAHTKSSSTANFPGLPPGENSLKTNFRPSYKPLIRHAENHSVLHCCVTAFQMRDVTAVPTEVTWPFLTVVRSKRLHLSLSKKRGEARQGGKTTSSTVA
jgi:hypothetical protein